MCLIPPQVPAISDALDHLLQGDVYGLARLRHVLHWAVFIAKSTLRQLQAEGQVAAYAEIARMRVSNVSSACLLHQACTC